MYSEVSAMVWKEWRELVQQRGGRSGLVNWLVMVGLVGVFIPAQSGAAWLQNPVQPLIWMWSPVLAVMWTMADSFAGERERHTLETLLSSRLSDRSIVFGKVAASLAYGWSMEIASLLAAAITVNTRVPGVGFYPLWSFFGLLVVSFAAILLVCALGALASLRTSTVRGAYQKLNIMILGIGLAFALVVQLIPGEQRERFLRSLAPPGPGLLGWLSLMLFLSAVGTLWLCLVRFQRNQLVLD